jgi:hypothetical protein
MHLTNGIGENSSWAAVQKDETARAGVRSQGA